MKHLSKKYLSVLGSACLAAALALAVATPVGAISNGTVDDPTNPKYPAVGTIFWHRPGGTYVGSLCAGTLIAPDVFLTAGHCANIFSEGLSSGLFDHVWVVFKPDLPGWYRFDSWPPPGVVATSVHEIHVHPSFQPMFSETHPNFADSLTSKNDNDPGDLAVLILDEPFTGAPPMALPEAGLLDDLNARHGLRDQQFGVAGYGWGVVFDPGQGPYLEPPDGLRKYASASFLALGPDWLFLNINEETGNGGACLMDSGGPAILNRCDEAGVCTRVVAGVFSWVDAAPCRALGKWGRLDTPSARAFLGQYVTLP